MALQHALDLERRDIHAGHFQHVVAPAAVNEVAVVVLDIFVAGARPFAQERRARLLAVVPIHHRAGRAAHLQFAHLAARCDDLAVVVDQADIVARHRLAGGAVFHLAGAVREENVQHLGRAEAVENVDAVALAPAPADIGRQRFAGGDAAAHFQLGALRRRGAGEKGGIERRHGVEHGDADASSEDRRPDPASAAAPTARWWRPPTSERSAHCRDRRRRTISPPNSRCRSR